MNVLLLHLDGKLPNVALMRIAAHDENALERMVRQTRALAGSPCEHEGEPCYGCASCFARETVRMLDADPIEVVDRAAIRNAALEEAAKECDREARACESHAKAFRELEPRRRMAVHVAHEMAARQSAACAHEVRRLATR
jgi:hypothetical protein